MPVDALPEPRRRYVKIMLQLGGAGESNVAADIASQLNTVSLKSHERSFYTAFSVYLDHINFRMDNIDVEPRTFPDGFFEHLHSRSEEDVCSRMFDAAAAAVRGSDVDEAARAIAATQQPSGAFFSPHPEEHPELRWYHELVMLHAVSSLALHSRHPTALNVMTKAAAFHHAETQPDHATTQPLALHAFLQDLDMLPTVDFMLHAAMTQGEVEPVSKLLLLDAAVALLLER